MEKVNYKNGYYEGDNSTYYSNGKLKSKGYWINGKKDDLWAWYHKNGQLEEEVSYRDGEISW